MCIRDRFSIRSITRQSRLCRRWLNAMPFWSSRQTMSIIWVTSISKDVVTPRIFLSVSDYKKDAVLLSGQHPSRIVGIFPIEGPHAVPIDFLCQVDESEWREWLATLQKPFSLAPVSHNPEPVVFDQKGYARCPNSTQFPSSLSFYQIDYLSTSKIIMG